VEGEPENSGKAGQHVTIPGDFQVHSLLSRSPTFLFLDFVVSDDEVVSNPFIAFDSEASQATDAVLKTALD
jgi:hypothetical protein